MKKSVGESSKMARLLLLFLLASNIPSQSNLFAEAQMVKMCLFYMDPSGHARSDPIINQTCPSDHVHTVRNMLFLKYPKRIFK